MRVRAAFDAEISVQRARVPAFDLWIGVWDRDNCATVYLTAAQARKLRDALDRLSSPRATKEDN
jgi:hypothetical protein